MTDTPQATKAEARVFRREKRTPKEDFWHTLAIGLPIGLALALLLPVLFQFIF